MQALSRLYERHEDARAAHDALLEAGFDPASVSIMATHTTQSLGFDSMDEMAVGDDPDRMAATAVLGFATGAAVGGAVGLLMSLGILLLPGIGPLMAIGPLAATLTVAALAGLAGAAAGLFAGAGVPPLDSNEYSRAERVAEALLFVPVSDDRAAEAGRIMDGYAPVPLTRTRMRRVPRRL